MVDAKSPISGERGMAVVMSFFSQQQQVGLKHFLAVLFLPDVNFFSFSFS